MHTAYLSFGSSDGDRDYNIFTSLKLVNKLPNTTITNVSDIYETKPWGFVSQAKFLNLVAEIKTDFTPFELLDACKKIEAIIGREKQEPLWSERLIDLDILLYDEEYLDSDNLTVPHKHLTKRVFNLVLLSEVCDKKIFGETLDTLIDRAKYHCWVQVEVDGEIVEITVPFEQKDWGELYKDRTSVMQLICDNQ